jgi:hypothetical protein
MTELPLSCPTCNAPWPVEDANIGEAHRCRRCGREVQVEVFPALLRPVQRGEAAEPSLVEGEATCFYHPRKTAVVACDVCGRLICALCELAWGRSHVCPPCFHAGAGKGDSAFATAPRVLYGHAALSLAILPLGITALAAIVLCIVGWGKPDSLVRRTRWTLRLALVLALLQLAAIGTAIGFAMQDAVPDG